MTGRQRAIVRGVVEGRSFAVAARAVAEPESRVHDGRRPSLLGDLNETFLGYIKDDRIICPGQNRRCMDRNNHEST